MVYVSIITTVDEELLVRASSAYPGLSDSELVAAALPDVSTKPHAVRMRAAYSTYDEYPVEAFGEWGDLASFRAARAA
ncbi:MAG: antitoxin MazE5 [Solirubrobacteraceae bacterium]